jgi:hypothetical protein
MGPGISGPPAWRIACAANAVQWLTVDTAIKYATDERSQSSCDVIRKNADKTLADLKNLEP